MVIVVKIKKKKVWLSNEPNNASFQSVVRTQEHYMDVNKIN